MLLAVADDNGRHFGQHCRQRASPISIKHRGQHKWINFYFNLLNLLNCFNGGIRKNMRKDAHPSSGMDSSNPHRWRGKRLHHHGDVVCHVVCAFCAVLSGSCHLSYVDKYGRITLRWGYGWTKWVIQACTIPWVTCARVKIMCHYVMVEADSHLKLLPASILDIYKVFEHIDMLSIGIW